MFWSYSTPEGSAYQYQFPFTLLSPTDLSFIYFLTSYIGTERKIFQKHKNSAY